MARRIHLSARNKILEGLASWFRTISLGLFAVAIVEPLRNPSALSALPFAIGLAGAGVTLGASVLMLAGVKDEK